MLSVIAVLIAIAIIAVALIVSLVNDLNKIIEVDNG